MSARGPAAPEDPALAARARAIERAAQPPHWPIRLAMLLGLVCFVGVVWARHGLQQVRGERAAVRAEIERVGDGADREVLGALQQSERDLRTSEALWRRRRLGLLLAGGVLVVGAYLARGVRRLYDKLRWVEIDPPRPPG